MGIGFSYGPFELTLVAVEDVPRCCFTFPVLSLKLNLLVVLYFYFSNASKQIFIKCIHLNGDEARAEKEVANPVAHSPADYISRARPGLDQA